MGFSTGLRPALDKLLASWGGLLKTWQSVRRDRVGNVGVSAPTADRQTQAAPVLESGIAT